MQNVKSLLFACLLTSLLLLQACTDQTKEIAPRPKATPEASRSLSTQTTCEECEWEYELARIQCSGGDIPLAPLRQGQKAARFGDPYCMQQAWQNYQNCLYGYEMPTYGRQICHITTNVDKDYFPIPEVKVTVSFWVVDSYTRQGGCTNAAPTTRLQKRMVGRASTSTNRVWDRDHIEEKVRRVFEAKLQELISQGYFPILTPDEMKNGVNKCGI